MSLLKMYNKAQLLESFLYLILTNRAKDTGDWVSVEVLTAAGELKYRVKIHLFLGRN